MANISLGNKAEITSNTSKNIGDNLKIHNTTTPLSSAYSSNATTPASNASQYDDDLASLARETNYKTYFSKLVQQANMNKLANKYYQNNLKANGLDTQGANSIAQTQLSNAYLNANAQALSDYNTEENSITESAYNRYKEAQTEAETESSSKVSAYQTYMQNAYNSGDLDDWYANNVTNNQELTDTEKAELQRYYESINGSNGSLLTSQEKAYSKLSSDVLTNSKEGIDVSTKDEINKMISQVTSNPPSTTTLYHLVNEKDGVEQYIAYDPSTGAYYRVSSERAKEYKGATYKITANESIYETDNAAEHSFPSDAKNGEKYIYNGDTYIFVKPAGSKGFWVKNND